MLYPQIFWSLLPLLLNLSSPHLARAQNGSTLFIQGIQALDKGHYQLAIKLLKKAQKKLPHWGLIHLELARALQFDGYPPPEILPHLKKALKLIPKNPRVHAQIALLWENYGQPQKALLHYSKALQLGDTRAFVCLRATRLWLPQNKAHLAIPCLLKLLRHGRELTQTHLLLAQAYERLQKPILAQQHYKKVLAQRPLWLPLLKMLFRFYQMQLLRDPKHTRRWKRELHHIRRLILRVVPPRKRRKLRPLLPSRR